MKKHCRGFWFWFWVTLSSVLTVGTLCGVSVTLAVIYTRSKTSEQSAAQAKEIAEQAKQLADQNALAWKKYTQSPFVKLSLDSVFGEDETPHPPGKRALYIHPCVSWGANRSAIVSRDVTVFVGRKITSQAGYSQNLTPGLERMTVAKNPNPMRPKLFAASNWPRYTYLIYSTFVQAASGGSAAEPMAPIAIYIIDWGQPLPKLGDPIPQGPGPNDPVQPNRLDACPISSASPAAAQ